MTAAETEAFAVQLALAKEHELPVLVHTPHRDKQAGTRETLALVERTGVPPEHVVVDHNNELTVGEVLATGCWAGFSIYPNTKMDEHRMVRILEEHGTDRMLVNSACDWGISRPAQGAEDRRGDARGRLRRGRDREGRLAQPGRVLRPERAADPRRARRAGPRRHVRGEQAGARGACMRLRHPDGSLLHVSYCSNVHPADDLDGVTAQLGRYAARVRERLDMPLLGVGLWVAAPALADTAAADRLAAEVRRLGLEVVTLNGFPYQAFHAPVVKRDVYRPSWAEPARSEYTLGLARLLARLLPDDVEEGSISTVPLGWRVGWGAAEDAAARTALEAVAEGLAQAPGRHGQAHPARARAGAGLHDRDGLPGRRVPRRARARMDRALPRRVPPGGAVRAGRRRPGAARGRGRPDREGAGLERAPRRGAELRRRRASSWPGSSSRASCTRCASG